MVKDTPRSKWIHCESEIVIQSSEMADNKIEAETLLRQKLFTVKRAALKHGKPGY
jgi:hypothetical protein